MAKGSSKKKAIKIKGKDYVMVRDRIIEFNAEFPKGCIETEIISDNERVVIKATVTPDIEVPDRVFTGISGSNPMKNIEKQSPYEVAETSAVGRALAMMGIGVMDSIASADEMNKAESYQEVTPDNDVMARFKKKVDAGLEECPKCGAEMKISSKGKPYCTALCWTK